MTSGEMAQSLDVLAERYHAAFARFAKSKTFAREGNMGRLLDSAAALLRHPDGPEVVFATAAGFDAAGLFAGTDWQFPERLQAGFVPRTFAGGHARTVTLECLNQLRLLAIAEGTGQLDHYAAEQAQHYLREVLGLNLDYVFERENEAARVASGRTRQIRRVLQFVAEHLGYENLLDQLVEEIWRLLRQRPIRMSVIREMISRLAVYCYDPEHRSISVPVGAERLVSSLFSPSVASREDPGVEVYRERLGHMDFNQLNEEATACARSMHDTGLVSPYHAVLTRYLKSEKPELLPVALGLSSTGLDSLRTYRQLVDTLLEKAVHVETCQCLYGLAALLERAVLHMPGVASSLWRQIKLPLTEKTRDRLATGCGSQQPPEVFLLAGVISLLGQPLGVGQGDNPTCQSARALSWWSYSDPDYLLQLLAWAARDDGILMSFRGQAISSAFLPEGGAGAVGHDLDPVSLVLVPHLDRIYAEMTRRCARVGFDPHAEVNPEFHGWQVGRGFAIAVNVTTGKLEEYERFIRLFYACYHPGYNGEHPVVHPQPVGLAVTDAFARFVGWHAITLLRVALDHTGQTRVYFYNPNNDSGQNWGNGVQVSTEGFGEFYGESSLPVDEFASRLYLFHYDTLEVWDLDQIPAAEVENIMSLAAGSWAADRQAE